MVNNKKPADILRISGFCSFICSGLVLLTGVTGQPAAHNPFTGFITNNYSSL
ncbi:hypothetical protein CSB69_2430 [Morganella morganii]|nr:hypothetical protein CSB69_2430 [Morganella morganii]